MKRLIKSSSDDEIKSFMSKFNSDLASEFSAPLFSCDVEDFDNSGWGYEYSTSIRINNRELIKRISEKVELEGDGERHIRLDDIGDVIVSLNDGDIEYIVIETKYLLKKACDFYYNYNYLPNIRCENGIKIVKDFDNYDELDPEELYSMNIKFYYGDSMKVCYTKKDSWNSTFFAIHMENIADAQRDEEIWMNMGWDL